ncbi:Uma2 family endonuclease [Desulfonatronospira sp.]|uniref:Uma2 family endonuclease n=1 Tax=Desulfonatronospira sp. TaxID=1962951 RepID=UPI0025BBBEEA|nr:Uma2 family endonuclease [Desulfonatronospira sp.]
MGLPEPSNEQEFTYRDYLHWPPDKRLEIIYGTVYDMTPAPLIIHQQILLGLARQIDEALENSSCRVLPAPVDVLLPRGLEDDEETDTVVQPDLVIVCDPDKIRDKNIRGAPDWIIEIVSPSTAGHDQIRKRELYEKSGVSEYWIVHPSDGLVIAYRLQDNAYGKPEVMELKDTTRCQAAPSVSVDWDRVMRRLREEGNQ